MLAKFASLVFIVCSLLTGRSFRRPFRRFFAKLKNLNVSLRLTALSLTLSHGERGQIGRKSKTWLGFDILNSLSRGERGQIGRKSKTWLGFDILNSLSRGEKGQIGWKSQTWLGFGILNPLYPWERVRERAANRQVCFLAILGRKTSSTLPFQHPLKPQQCQP